MSNEIEKLDFSGFWDNNEYAERNYIGAPVTEAMLIEVQEKLKFRLPISYVEILKKQNGGIPVNIFYRALESPPWAGDYVAISGIYGIDKNIPCSIVGKFGNKFWIDEWGYPDIGIYFCDCPSAGHEMLCLDYSECGKNGEPKVVHIDQESGYKKTLVAENFISFILGLEKEEKFD